MTTIHVHLNEAAYEKARKVAAAQGRSVEALAAELLEHCDRGVSKPAEPVSPGSDPRSVIGMWADDPDAVDEMLKSAMEMREERNRALMERIEKLDLP